MSAALCVMIERRRASTFSVIAHAYRYGNFEVRVGGSFYNTWPPRRRQARGRILARAFGRSRL